MFTYLRRIGKFDEKAVAVLLGGSKKKDKKEEAPKHPKSTFKSVDPTLKLETWILKNSDLKLLYYMLKLDQNSLKFKFPTSKLDQQTWMLTLDAWELLPFCLFSLILRVELQQLSRRTYRFFSNTWTSLLLHLFDFSFSIFTFQYWKVYVILDFIILFWKYFFKFRNSIS